MQYNIKSLSSLQTIVVDEADLIFSNGGKRFQKLLQSFRDCVVRTGHLQTSLQFIFAAATMPRRGEGSVLQKILTQFPKINYITSGNVHRYVPTLTNADVFVKEETKLPQLLKCLNILNGDLPFENFENLQDPEIRMKFAKMFTTEERKADENRVNSGIQINEQLTQEQSLKVLVFANTVSMVKNIHEFLNCYEGCSFKAENKSQNPVIHQFHKDCVKTTTLPHNEEAVTKTGPTYSWRGKVERLHKDMSKDERQEVLAKFRRNEIAVLVSTDLASRGLDVSHITHVIQVDYARNAADTLHRAGRTARAGSLGIVINFITHADKDLWHAIKITERGLGNEGFQEIFSRNRQFSRRIKKRINHIDR
jgi:superfamily II DNA/RNA helicase